MSERVFKWNIPVDDEAHPVKAFPVHVACQTDDYETVQVWTLSADDDERNVLLKVFGTGQPIPDGASYVGTALAAQGNLVWHVFDVTFANKDSE